MSLLVDLIEEVETLGDGTPTEFQGQTTMETGKVPTDLTAEIREMLAGLGQEEDMMMRDGTEMLGDMLGGQGEMTRELTGWWQFRK